MSSLRPWVWLAIATGLLGCPGGKGPPDGSAGGAGGFSGGGVGGGAGGGVAGGLGGGTSGGTPALFVEPTPALSTSLSALAIDDAGALHAVHLASDGALRYLTCTSSCEDAGSWTTTELDAGVAMRAPAIKVTADGRPRVVAHNSVAGTYGDYVGFCDSSCTQSSSWRFTKVDLPASSTGRSPSHYFAMSGDSMMLGLAGTQFLGAMMCPSNCQQPSSWSEVDFSGSSCVTPNVAMAPNGTVALSCTVSLNGDDVLEVYTCTGNCASANSWHGVTGLAESTILGSDLAISTDGKPAVALWTGTQSTPDTTNRAAYVSCTGDCSMPASWQSVIVSTAEAYRRSVSIDVDAQNRVAIAFDGTSLEGSGLQVATCAGNCGQAASWQTRLWDTGQRLSAVMPVLPPSGCDQAVWVPSKVTQAVLTGGRVTTASEYQAVGVGGLCTSNPFQPAASYRSVRSVLSLGLGAH